MFPLKDSVPSRTIPFINFSIIILNIIVFYKELQLGSGPALERFISDYGLIPSLLLANPMAHLPDVFTSMFLHGGWGHLIGNMWFLYVFGNNVEDSVGHIKYFFYYLLMGVGAAAIQVLANPGSAIPMVGASGAIAGILGSYIILHPGARVTTFFILVIFIRIVEVPAWMFLGLWFIIQAVNGVGSLQAQALHGDVGGVAWWAHAGGFIAGFLGIQFFRKRRRRTY